MASLLFTSPYIDNNGNSLSSGKIYTYAAGTTTPKATYTTSAATIANTNPVILDSSGFAQIWLTGSYKIEVRDSNDVVLRTLDNVNDYPAGSSASTEWVASTLTPTFISSTSFSVLGNQTADLQVGRRIRITDSSTLYGTITTSVFTTLTTVTVLLDSGAITGIITAFALGFASVNNPSISPRTIAGLSGVYNGGTAGGTANALTLTVPGLGSSWGVGTTFVFKPSATSTTNSTVNINGVGAGNIVRPTSTGTTATVGGEIINNVMCVLVYDGTNYVLSGSFSGQIAGTTWTGPSRTSGTTYTNTTPYYRAVLVNALSTTGCVVTVGGTAILSQTNTQYMPIFFLVPPGATYVVTAGSGISSWAELG